MTEYSIATVIEASERVFEYIYNNKSLPNYVLIQGTQVKMPVFLDLATRAVLQIKSNNHNNLLVKTVAVPNQASPISPSGKIPQDNYMDAASRLYGFIVQYGRAPSSLATNIGKLGFNEMVYAYAFVCTHYRRNNNLPSHVQIGNVTAVTSDGCRSSQRFLSDTNLVQNTNYFCACNIFQQIMFELYGIVISEYDIAKAMGTTKDGTGHNEIISGGKAIAKQYGHSVSIEFRNYSDMTEEEIAELVEDPNVGVFFHDLYKKTWGHYEYAIGICIALGIYIIANSLSGGYIERRSRETMKSYISGISQPSVGIVRKIN